MTTHKPKLLVVTSTFPEDQTSTQPDFVLQLSIRLQDRFAVTVLAPDQPGTEELAEFRGLKIVRFRYWIKRYQTLSGHSGISARLQHKPWRMLLIPFFIAGEILATRRLLKHGEFDLVHAHWLLPQGACVLLANRLLRQPVPVLTTAHGADVYALQWPGLSAIKSWVLRRSTAVAAVSKAMQRDLGDLLSPTSIDIPVLPMGVDLQHNFTPTGEQQRNPDQILFVGRLVPKKGVHHLIAALGMINKKFSKARLIVVGSGPEEGRLRQLAASYGMGDQVCFHGAGSRDQVVKQMRASGIVVVPSITAADGDREGLGLVTIEAMGCGCAVIAHDFAAVHDVIEDGKNGLLVPQADETALSEALAKLLNDPKRQQELGLEGRRSVLESFDWLLAANRYSDLLETMLSRGTSR
jgi:glycosyltransferase involved in cell wall biosynthesis